MDDIAKKKCLNCIFYMTCSECVEVCPTREDNGGCCPSIGFLSVEEALRADDLDCWSLYCDDDLDME